MVEINTLKMVYLIKEEVKVNRMVLEMKQHSSCQMKAAFLITESLRLRNRQQKSRASVSIGKSGSNDWTNRSMVDMNGDGLPDMLVFLIIKSRLNEFGHDFTLTI